jgi:hypothetical protein
MNDPKSRRQYSTDEVGAIVRIALERHGTEGRISHDELLETAREIGVSADDMEEAVAEEARIREARAAIEARRMRARRWFSANLIAYIVVNAALFAIDRTMTGGTWYVWPLLIWGVVLALHAVFLIFPKADEVEQLEATRGGSRARIDEAFGASVSRPSTRRPRIVRSAPPPPGEDEDPEADSRARERQQD